MNWERGFRRIIHVLAIIGAVVGFFIGGVMTDEFWREGPPPTLIAILSVPVSYCLIWLIYYLIEWLVLGFVDNEQKKNSFEKGAIMTLKEIAEKTNQLRDIDKKEEHEKAKELAIDLGASIFDPYAQGKETTTGVIIQSCYRVLQTQTMLVACKTANRSSKIAIVAAIAAVVGVLITLVFIFTR